MTGRGGLVSFMTMSKMMVRLVTFSGMIVALAVASLLLATVSQTGRVEAAQEAPNCQQIEMSVDDGYGVSAPAPGACK